MWKNKNWYLNHDWPLDTMLEDWLSLKNTNFWKRSGVVLYSVMKKIQTWWIWWVQILYRKACNFQGGSLMTWIAFGNRAHSPICFTYIHNWSIQPFSQDYWPKRDKFTRMAEVYPPEIMDIYQIQVRYTF